MQVQRPNIVAINLDRAFRDIVKARDEVRQCSFAGTTATDECNGFPFPDREVQVLEDGVFSPVIAKILDLKNNFLLKCLELDRVWRRDDFWLGVENFENAAQCSDAFLKLEVEAVEFLDRIIEQKEAEQERGEISGSDLAVEDEVAPIGHNGCARCGSDDFNHRS